MRVERATVEDVAAVLAVERETPEAPHWAEDEYLRAVSGDVGEMQSCLLVLRGDGELLGFAVGRVVADVGEIESVVVRASARHQGVGRALCMALIAWAWEQGAKAMELEVRAGSAGARALYARLGFVECGRRPGYYRAPVDDAVLMRLNAGLL